MKLLLKQFSLLLFVIFVFTGCSKQENTKPKNIIIFIGDGMGYNHVDATSYYEYGELGLQVYESFPIKLGMSTFMVGGEVYKPDSAWTNFKYILKKPTDSAASGTALATGTKTYKARLSVDTLGNILQTVLDFAETIGKSTGVVTTVPFSNATPAAFVAHNASRYQYKEIAKEMIMDSKVDVIMGGGHPFYNPDGTPIKSINERFVGEKEAYDMVVGDSSALKNEEKIFNYVGGKNTWDALKNGEAGSDADNDGINDPWQLIENREMFQKYAKGETPKRVIGIFKSGQSTQVERDDSLDDGMPFSAPLNDQVPTLTEMTLSTINILSKNPNGFVMMSEGGAIDWVAHHNQLHRTIEEQIDFNKAIEATCKWVEENSSWDETLIIVTADHETGYLLGPGSNVKVNDSDVDLWKPIGNNGKGKLPSVEWFSKDHTNSLVPFYAKGAGSILFQESIKGNDDVKGSYIDNTDVGNVVKLLLK
ncbi:MAG: alkaline phosphatase [Bacteroidetes bacterium]|nr:alkaline phosphatase [Bacteroidota bacterium]MBU1115869.1 alkaline phosphatase [Bacteroidota bacterium]MBU1797983.1 alkaline phosphatase [Bacteroidota bacterium]